MIEKILEIADFANNYYPKNIRVYLKWHYGKSKGNLTRS